MDGSNLVRVSSKKEYYGTADSQARVGRQYYELKSGNREIKCICGVRSTHVLY